MWNRLRHRDDETGQILVMVAGGMIVFLLIAGLVIDTGVGYPRAALDAERRRPCLHGRDQGHRGPLPGWRAHRRGRLHGDRVQHDQQWLRSRRWLRLVGRATSSPGSQPPVIEIDLGPVTTAARSRPARRGSGWIPSSSADTFFMRVVGISKVDVATDATAMTSGILNEARPAILLPIAAFDRRLPGWRRVRADRGRGGSGQLRFPDLERGADAPAPWRQPLHPGQPRHGVPGVDRGCAGQHEHQCSAGVP